MGGFVQEGELGPGPGHVSHVNFDELHVINRFSRFTYLVIKFTRYSKG